MPDVLILCPIRPMDSSDFRLLDARIRAGTLLRPLADLCQIFDATVQIITDRDDVETVSRTQGFGVFRVPICPDPSAVNVFDYLDAAGRTAGMKSEDPVLVVDWRVSVFRSEIARDMISRLTKHHDTPVVRILKSDDNPVQFKLLFNYVGVACAFVPEGSVPGFPDFYKTRTFAWVPGQLASELSPSDKLLALAEEGSYSKLHPVRLLGGARVRSLAAKGLLYRRDSKQGLCRIFPRYTDGWEGLVPPFPTGPGQPVRLVTHDGAYWLAVREDYLGAPLLGIVHACRNLQLGEAVTTVHIEEGQARELPRLCLEGRVYALVGRIMLPAQSAGLVGVVVQPVKGPHADFSAPMPPMEGLWRYVPGRQGVCLPSGRAVTGRQSFPPIYQMDASCVAVCSSGLATLERDLREGRVWPISPAHAGCEPKPLAPEPILPNDVLDSFGASVAPPCGDKGIDFRTLHVSAMYLRPGAAWGSVSPVFSHAVWHAWDTALKDRALLEEEAAYALKRTALAVRKGRLEAAAAHVAVIPGVAWRPKALLMMAMSWRCAGKWDRALACVKAARIGEMAETSFRRMAAREIALCRTATSKVSSGRTDWLHLDFSGGWGGERRKSCGRGARSSLRLPLALHQEHNVPCSESFRPTNVVQVPEGALYAISNPLRRHPPELFRIDPSEWIPEKLSTGIRYHSLAYDASRRCLFGLISRGQRKTKYLLSKMNYAGAILDEIDISQFVVEGGTPFALKVSKKGFLYFVEYKIRKIFEVDYDSRSVRCIWTAKNRFNKANMAIVGDFLTIFQNNVQSIVRFNTNTGIFSRCNKNFSDMVFSLVHHETKNIYFTLSRIEVGAAGVFLDKISAYDKALRPLGVRELGLSWGYELFSLRIEGVEFLGHVDVLHGMTVYRVEEQT